VRLSLSPSVAALWLFPRLRALEGDDLHLELILEHRLADFGEGADLAIRCGKGPWAGVCGVQIWHEQMHPIAAPALAERLGREPTAEALLELPILHDSNIEGWRRWLAAVGVNYVPRSEDRRFEDYNLVVDACIQGLGIALARPPLSSAALESGRLVSVSSRTIDNPVAFHLIRPDDALRGPAQEFARRFLRETGHDKASVAAFTAPRRQKA
jgi:DNA-binding transcriptional LysR family regulator